MSEGFHDPAPPPEGGSSLRAADLKNKPLLLKPVEKGMWDAKPAEYDDDGNETKSAQDAAPYVACDVYVLDRAGVVETGTGVRFSWWKVVKQLEDSIGKFVGGVPQKEATSNSIVFVKLDDVHREVAKKVVADIHDERPM